MEIQINVMLGVTPRLEQLAEKAIAALLGRPAPQIVGLPEMSKDTGFLKVDHVPETVQIAIPVAEQPEASEPEPPAPEPPGEQPEPAKPTEPVQPEAAIPDDETLRTMMDIAISRVCGTNEWKESQDGRVITLRRSCTGCFKEIARRLGAEKPTALQGEARNRFLAELDNIYIDVSLGTAVWQAF